MVGRTQDEGLPGQRNVALEPRKANRSQVGDGSSIPGPVPTPLRIFKLTHRALLAGDARNGTFESPGESRTAWHRRRRLPWTTRRRRVRIGSPRSTSDWYSAAVRADDDRTLIEKDGHRPRGTPHQAGTCIAAFQSRFFPGRRVVSRGRIRCPLRGSDRSPRLFHAATVHPSTMARHVSAYLG
jgi:hypothetical protein